MLFIVGLNGEIIEWNRPLYRRLGYTGKTVPSGGWASLIAPGYIPAFSPALERARFGERVQLQTVLMRNDGGLVPADVYLRRVVFQGRHVLMAEVVETVSAPGAEDFQAQFRELPIPALVWRGTDAGFVLAEWNVSAESGSGGRVIHDLGRNAAQVFSGNPEIADLMLRCATERRRMELDIGCMFWNERVRLHLTLSSHSPEIVYMYIQDITTRTMAEERLLECQDALRSLAAELTLAEQNERRAIAADLHDSMNQTLAVAQFRLDALDADEPPLPVRDGLQQIRDLITRAIRETRDLMFALCPPILTERGFQSAAQWLTDRFQAEQGIPARFVCDGPVVRLDTDIETLLYKALRELLHNVGKHARAGTVTISTWSDRELFYVAVEDDGVGLDVPASPRPAPAPGGFGLFSIRERLRCIGGDCVIESAMNQGTRCTLRVPLKKCAQ